MTENKFNLIMGNINLNNMLIYEDLSDRLDDDTLIGLNTISQVKLDFTESIKLMVPDIETYCYNNGIMITKEEIITFVIDYIQLLIYYGYDLLINNLDMEEHEHYPLCPALNNITPDMMISLEQCLLTNTINGNYPMLEYTLNKEYVQIPNKELFVPIPFNYVYYNNRHLLYVMLLYGDVHDTTFKKPI